MSGAAYNREKSNQVVMTLEQLREELSKAETLLFQVQDELRNARAVLERGPEYEEKYAHKVALLREEIKRESGSVTR